MLWERLQPYLLGYLIPILMRLEIDITTASIRRTTSVEPEPEAEVARTSTAHARNEEDTKYKWRFIHLTFQEFFAARRLLTLLHLETGAKRFYRPTKMVFGKHLKDKLYNAWYREVLLLLASCADDGLFGDLIDYLLADADASGVNEHLAVVMLEERREHPTYEAKRTAVRKVQERRLLASVVAALSHPFAELRQQAVQQMHSLGLSISSIAKHLTSELKTGGNYIVKRNWFLLQALMESLIDIRGEYALSGGEQEVGKQDATLAVVVAEGLLNHQDLDVVRAAARGLGAIGVRRCGPCVCRLVAR
jgi:hypothetical protein